MEDEQTPELKVKAETSSTPRRELVYLYKFVVKLD